MRHLSFSVLDGLRWFTVVYGCLWLFMVVYGWPLIVTPLSLVVEAPGLLDYDRAPDFYRRGAETIACENRGIL